MSDSEKNTVPDELDPLMGLVAESRRQCGCTRCQGGYPIGEYTISNPGVIFRPTSCVVEVLLAHKLSGLP